MKQILMCIFTMLVSYSIYANPLEEFMVDPNTYVDGQPVSDYTKTWWQWTYTMPKDKSPVRDVTGKYCHVGQRGNVWFLAGGYGTSKIKRTCVVPEGKYIFFPVINMVYWPRYKGSMTCDAAIESAALNNDKAIDIEVNLDSTSAWNPANTRIRPDSCFDLLGLLPKELNAPKVYPAASDGYWVMLKPLSKGKHFLSFKARYNRDKGAYSQMAQDIEYELTIE
jgi:hypothetical protein